MDETRKTGDERNPAKTGKKQAFSGKNGAKPGKKRAKPGKTGQKTGKNGQKTGERNRTLAKQGKTESFAESWFGFGHPWFPPCLVRQNQQKKTFLFARRFLTIFKQKCSNLRPLLSITFPQGFWISKNIGHPIGKWGQKDVETVPQKWTHTQTDKQTDGHFDL